MTAQVSNRHVFGSDRAVATRVVLSLRIGDPDGQDEKAKTAPRRLSPGDKGEQERQVGAPTAATGATLADAPMRLSIHSRTAIGSGGERRSRRVVSLEVEAVGSFEVVDEPDDPLMSGERQRQEGEEQVIPTT
jgi:hypothetical protein